MKAKQRAKWWIVSTHVLTTGFAIPFLAAVIGGLLCSMLELQGMTGFMINLGMQALGYIGGTYYSLSYLKKSAITSDWQGCMVPATVSFAALAVFGLVANRAQVSKATLVVLGLLLFYGVIIAAFWRITSNGFRALQSGVQPPDAVQQNR